MRAAASVSIGRRRLPPEEIRWLAIWGMSSTCDPALDRISSLTLPMSSRVSAIRFSIEPLDGSLPLRLTTTPTRPLLTVCLGANVGWAAYQGQGGELARAAAIYFAGATCKPSPMIEIVRTNDPVLISFVEALMRDAGIDFMVADQNM